MSSSPHRVAKAAIDAMNVAAFLELGAREIFAALAQGLTVIHGAGISNWLAGSARPSRNASAGKQDPAYFLFPFPTRP